MATSEIEKLERRYAENPNGLTFAPLAEVCRKNGDVTRALELLGPGLDRHPDYIPARIVLGRCHLDLGALVEAEQAFQQVVAIDGENVIALKALADIGERMARYDDAERWLTALLAVDRNNDLARDQLARVGALRQQDALTNRNESDLASDAVGEEWAEAVPSGIAEPTVAEPHEPATAAEAEVHQAAGVVEPGVFEPAIVEDFAATEPSFESGVNADLPEVPAVADEASDIISVEQEPAVFDDLVDGAVPTDEGFEVHEPESLHLEKTVAPVSGLMTPESDTLRDEIMMGDGSEFEIETADDLVLRPALNSEFQMPDASQELMVSANADPDPLGWAGTDLMAEAHSPSPASDVAETAASGPDATLDATQDVAPEPAALPVESEPELVAEAEAETPSIEAAADEPLPEEPPLIVTETMAEVLLQQGHRADALQIYRELERRSGGDERLRAKLAELETEAVAPADPAPTYAADDTGGESVAVFFRRLLAARLPAPPAQAPVRAPATASPVAGAPTRPAADTLSLSAVFGDGAPSAPPAMSSDARPAGVSFDEFFGARDGGLARAPQAPEPQTDDLDQFHAWLQNLKR